MHLPIALHPTIFLYVIPMMPPQIIEVFHAVGRYPLFPARHARQSG